MSEYEVFCKPEYKALLQANTLGNFESLWKLEAQWVEEPNVRRGGWSGVVRHTLQTSEGEEIEVYIKRQEGHISRTFAHPLSGILTLKKEFANIQRLNRYSVPTLEPLYFGLSGNRAILITLGLTTHESLEHIDPSTLSRHERQILILSIATALNHMHRAHMQHNCMYPKHLLVKPKADEWDVRIIDLEKMKRTLWKRSAIYRDLSTLFRHSDMRWTKSDRVFFFRQYCDEQLLTPGSKKIWRKITARSKHKRRSTQH